VVARRDGPAGDVEVPALRLEAQAADGPAGKRRDGSAARGELGADEVERLAPGAGRRVQPGVGTERRLRQAVNHLRPLGPALDDAHGAHASTA
jgi:hypothetical protein